MRARRHVLLPCYKQIMEQHQPGRHELVREAHIIDFCIIVHPYQLHIADFGLQKHARMIWPRVNSPIPGTSSDRQYQHY